MPKANENKDDGNTVDLEAQVKTLTELVGTLAGGFDGQKKAIESLTANVGNLSNMTKEQLAAQQAALAADADTGDDNTLGDVDLENLNRSDFMDVILGQVNKGFEKITDQITGQLDTVKDTVSSTNIKSELKEVQDKHSDFNHYKAEIAELAKQNPEMSIQNMYTLAKANNPEKVAEVEKIIEKEKEESQAADEAKEKLNKTKGYGGLTPTSGQRQETPSDMTQEAAGEAAWDEAMAGIEPEQ